MKYEKWQWVRVISLPANADAEGRVGQIVNQPAIDDNPVLRVRIPTNDRVIWEVDGTAEKFEPYDGPPVYTDLKLIDELLCDLRSKLDITPEQLINHSGVTAAALRRLHQAFTSGEMPEITLTWSRLFDRAGDQLKD